MAVVVVVVAAVVVAVVVVAAVVAVVGAVAAFTASRVRASRVGQHLRDKRLRDEQGVRDKQRLRDKQGEQAVWVMMAVRAVTRRWRVRRRRRLRWTSPTTHHGCRR